MSPLVVAIAAGLALVLSGALAYGRWNVGREDPRTRAVRQGAVVVGAIPVGAPFELRGTADGRSATLWLELDLVQRDVEIEVSLAATGVRLSFEVEVDGQVVASEQAKVPSNSDDHAAFRTFGRRDLRIRGTVAVADLGKPAAGAPIAIRGRAEPLPDNRVTALRVFVGSAR